MLRARRLPCIAALLAGAGFVIGLVTAPPAGALDQRDALAKVVAVGGFDLLLRQYAEDMDHFINSMLRQRGIEQEGMTLVAPIMRVGGEAPIGAAQVTGPPEQVRRVQAVAEIDMTLAGVRRARALVPVAAAPVEADDIRAIGGVGVSALITPPL